MPNSYKEDSWQNKLKNLALIILATIGLGGLVSLTLEPYLNLVPEIKPDYTLDHVEIVSRVCIDGRLIVHYKVLKDYEGGIQFYVSTAGYADIFSVVTGNCKVEGK